jgi:hypothetical protein
MPRHVCTTHSRSSFALISEHPSAVRAEAEAGDEWEDGMRLKDDAKLRVFVFRIAMMKIDKISRGKVFEQLTHERLH